MTKQEEIREGLAQRLFNIRQPDEHFKCLWENRQNAWYCEADKLLSYLHAQGVVVKVDRELPIFSKEHPLQVGDIFYEFAQQDMLRGGYKATKPLVK